MRYNPPVLSTDLDASYINADASIGQRGSAPPAESIEYPQREIVNAVSLGGLIPSNDDLTQLWQVINRSSFIYAEDTGFINNIVIVPINLPSAYKKGLAYEIKVAATNTGAVTINVNNLGARPLVRMTGGMLQAGDIVAGGICLVVYDGIQFQLLTSSALQISEASLLHYGIDTGAANALVVTVTPGVTSYAAGLTCEVVISHPNTGATTINVQSMGVKNLVRANGGTLMAGDLLTGAIALICYDGTNFQLVNVQVAGPGGSTADYFLGPNRPYWIAVNSATVTAPPGSPTVGDTYLIPVGASGAWSGLGNQLTQWTGATGWETRDYPLQSVVGVADQDDLWKRTVSGWRTIFASIAEAQAGVSTVLCINPADLNRAASIQGPLRPPFISVNSATISTPPGGPVRGDTYLVPPVGATGAWSGLGNFLVQWDGSQWLSKNVPIKTMVGTSDTDDWMHKMPDGTWRTSYATLAEALQGTSTTTIINPADLSYVLAHQPGGDDLSSDLFWYGCQ